MTAKKAGAPGYQKISATLDRDLLRRIRERTDNVSAYLNEAAEERLYHEHLREMIRELEAQGFDGSGGMPRLREIADRWEREKAERRGRSRAG